MTLTNDNQINEVYEELVKTKQSQETLNKNIISFFKMFFSCSIGLIFFVILFNCIWSKHLNILSNYHFSFPYTILLLFDLLLLNIHYLVIKIHEQSNQILNLGIKQSFTMKTFFQEMLSYIIIFSLLLWAGFFKEIGIYQITFISLTILNFIFYKIRNLIYIVINKTPNTITIFVTRILYILICNYLFIAGGIMLREVK